MTDKKLTHPESKQTITVRTEDVEKYESQGWSIKDEKPAEKK